MRTSQGLVSLTGSPTNQVYTKRKEQRITETLKRSEITEETLAAFFSGFSIFQCLSVSAPQCSRY